MRKLPFFSEHTELETLTIGKSADPILRTAQKGTRSLLKDDVEKDDVVVVLQLPQKRAQIK